LIKGSIRASLSRESSINVAFKESILTSLAEMFKAVAKGNNNVNIILKILNILSLVKPINVEYGIKLHYEWFCGRDFEENIHSINVTRTP
jgi:hypothetical protein